MGKTPFFKKKVIRSIKHNNWSALIGSWEGVKKLSKLESAESSFLLELFPGNIMDVINDPTNQIDNAFNNANKNEEITHITIITL